MLRMALVSHVEDGKSLGPIASQANVSRATLINWLSAHAPETILKGAAVYDALTGKRETTTDDEDA
jgi:transposase